MIPAPGSGQCPVPRDPELTPCDGSWQAYHRHQKMKEKPCRASKQAWAAEVRARRKKGKS